MVIACFWALAASFGILWVWRHDITDNAIPVGLTLCLVTSILSYTRIHIKIRHHQAQIQNNVPHGQQSGEGIPLHIARYKKTVSSIMWVQLALVACYLPWLVVPMLYFEYEVAWIATETLVFLNSSLNPILYCWKITEVKQAVKGTIRQLFCL